MKRNPLFIIISIFAFLVFIVQCKKEDLIIVDEEPPIVIEDTIPPPPPPPPPPNPLLFTSDELALINSGDSSQAFTILNYWIQPDSVILRTLSTEISLDEDNYDNLRLLADRMKVAMLGANGIGIAAPQIGINRRVFWAKRFDKPNQPLEVYFNPTIINYSGINAMRPDGCLSVPRGAQWPTSNTSSYRYRTIEVEYYLIDGTKVQETISDANTSHVFQHEYDHLDGIMFMDRNTQW
jgi:peptide deformylase